MWCLQDQDEDKDQGQDQDEDKDKDQGQDQDEDKDQGQDQEQDQNQDQDQDPYCTVKAYFCNPTADDMLYKIDETVNTAKECSDACQKDDSCKFFTFFNFRGSPSCYALKGCQEKKPRCSMPSNCVSGEKNCKQLTGACPRLGKKDGDKARWRCKGINPYKDDIPEGTHCYAT